MRPPTALVLTVAAGLASALPSAAAPVVKLPAVPQVKFTDYTLPNGLRVLLVPDKSAPVVAVTVTYNVGSRNEREGRTGFAHLFEHMMFQGSENVGKGEHFQLVDDNGGTFNGTTSQDRTNYFETLPANQMELALYLEADRMRALDISQTNLDNQRAVVQEEKRQSYDNQPYGGLQDALLNLSYSSFAYKHSTIGSMADLDAATLGDVRSFFRTNYAPNNATLALVGDFQIGDAKKTIARLFGPIERQPAPPPPDISEPAPSGEKRETLNDALARLPLLTLSWRTVPGDDPDFYALSILGGILGRGRTSRFYAPVVETQKALNASAGIGESRGPSLFSVRASLPPGGDPKAAEEAILAEIERVKTDGVTADEVLKAQTQALAGTMGRLQTALGRAQALSQYAVYYNDPNRINTLLTRLQAVTPADVQRVAQKYLTAQNRVVITVLPTDKSAAGGNAQ